MRRMIHRVTGVALAEQPVAGGDPLSLALREPIASRSAGLEAREQRRRAEEVRDRLRARGWADAGST